MGTSSYATALVNKYIRHAVPEPEKNFDAVYAGIRKAPRKLRDYLMALMVGYYAVQQLPYYEEALAGGHRPGRAHDPRYRLPELHLPGKGVLL